VYELVFSHLLTPSADPFDEYPYAKLVAHHRSRSEPEYELRDTGVFKDQRYFDVFTEYAKASENDICIRIVVANRSPTESSLLHLLPTLWFRNSWVWSCPPEDMEQVIGSSVRWSHQRFWTD
jgi:hypothetical protein